MAGETYSKGADEPIRMEIALQHGGGEVDHQVDVTNLKRSMHDSITSETPHRHQWRTHHAKSRSAPGGGDGGALTLRAYFRVGVAHHALQTRHQTARLVLLYGLPKARV